MNIKVQIEKLEEENNNITDKGLLIYYILRHVVYDEPEKRETFILCEHILTLLKDLKASTEGIDSIIRYMQRD